MNERIGQLAEKSGLLGPSSRIGNSHEATERFAELIVKEMLQTCEDHPAWTGRMIGEQIKQHFGIID